MSTTRVAPGATTAPAPGILDGIPVDELRNLRPVGKRPPLSLYLSDVWSHRNFIWGLATAQLRASNGRNRLGNLWIVLTPLLNGLVYFLVFGKLLETGKGVPNFVGYLIVGVFLFTYTTRTIVEGSKAISGNRKLIQTLAFPRAVLPISVVVQQMLSLGVSVVAMGALVLLVATPDHLTWRMLLIVPVLALQTLFNAGLVLIFARFVAQVSDLANVLPFGLRAWLYLSGVFYASSRFDNHPTLKAIFESNPGHAFLTLARDAVLYAKVSEPKVWLVAVGWTVPLLIVGFLLFWHAEEKYARD
jgi:teichoic acid transport system permease protein